MIYTNLIKYVFPENLLSFLSRNDEYGNTKFILFFILIFFILLIFYIILTLLYFHNTLKEKVILIKQYKEDKIKKKTIKYIVDKNDDKYYIEKNYILNLIKKSKNIDLNNIQINKIYKISYYGKDKNILNNLEQIL